MAEQINVLLIMESGRHAEAVVTALRSYADRKFAVTHSADLDSAHSHLKSGKSAGIILLDYDLPRGGGTEGLRAIRESAFDLPVILLTGSQDFRVVVEAMKYGVEDYLLREESGDSVLPRAITAALERRILKRKIADAEFNKLISQRKTDAVKELVVTVCHEINNPLAAVKISSDILSRQESSPQVKALLARLNENISRIEERVIRLRDSQPHP